MGSKSFSEILIAAMLVFITFGVLTWNFAMAQGNQPSGAGISSESVEVSLGGSVSNGTSGGPGPAGQEVALNKVVGERAERVSSIKTDSNGRFRFPRLGVDRGATYFLSTNYRGVDYFSETLPFKDKAQVDAEIKVYETTESDEHIRVGAHHIVIENVGNVLQVREFMMIANTGNTTYIGLEGVASKEREVLRFLMPPGMVNPEINQGVRVEDLVTTEDGFADRSAFRAGSTKEIIFGYKMPYSSSRYTLSKRINYPTDMFQFLTVDTGIKYRSDGLSSSGPTQIGDKRYFAFAKREVKPGEAMAISISGLPLPRDEGFIRLVVMGSILGLGIVGLAYYLLAGERRAAYAGFPPSGNGPVDDVKTSLETERRNLIRSIARLDEDYAAGRIKDGNYRRQRAAKKERLIQLTHRLKAIGRSEMVKESTETIT